jgi:hypothetical protein
MGSFALIKGYVMENTAVPHSGELSAGGGLLVASKNPDIVAFYGGQVSGNKAYLGGGVAILSGSVVMSGGAIVDNTASLEDGLVLLGSQDEAVFIQQGGTVSRIGEFRHPEIWRRQ